MTGSTPMGGLGRQSGLTLEYPMSLGTFDRYEDAQRAVDELSDRQFPVENCMIVGTDLRQVERVLGRLTWARVAMGGAASGVWLGLFVGLILALFSTSSDALMTIVACVVFGAVFVLVWSLIGYGFTRGARDFASVSKVVATRYEVLTEHKLAEQARDLLAEASIVGTPGPNRERAVSPAEPAGQRGADSRSVELTGTGPRHGEVAAENPAEQPETATPAPEDQR